MRTSTAIVPALFAACGLTAPALEARQFGSAVSNQMSGGFPGFGYPGQVGGLAPDSRVCGFGFDARVYTKQEVDSLVQAVCPLPATGRPGFPSYFPNVDRIPFDQSGARPESLFFTFPIRSRTSFPGPFTQPGGGQPGYPYAGPQVYSYPGMTQPQTPQPVGGNQPQQTQVPVPQTGNPMQFPNPADTQDRDFVVYDQFCTAVGVVTRTQTWALWGDSRYVMCDSPQGATPPAPVDD